MRRARAIVALVWVAGCAPAPPPEPPRVEALELTPAIADHVLVLGTQGAAEARLDVVGVSLDGTSAPTRGFVAADGSFLLEVPGLEGDVLRIQTEEAGVRSAPIDVIAAFGPVAEAAPTLPCVRAPAAIELSAERLEIENDCDRAIAIESIELRAPAAITLGEAPATIEPGGAVTVELTRTGGPVDAIVLVHIAAPVEDRRAVSVLGR